MKNTCFLLAVLIFSCNTKHPNGDPAAVSLYGLEKYRFTKVDSINPVLLPSPGEKFLCPVSGKTVSWSEKNVLNPAAVVKGMKQGRQIQNIPGYPAGFHGFCCYGYLLGIVN